MYFRRIVMNKRILDFVSVLDDSSVLDSRIGLFDGYSGIALFQFCCAEMLNSDHCLSMACESINKIMNAIDQKGYKSISFCSGLSGFAWMLQYVSKKKLLYLQNLSEIFFAIDRIIYREVDKYLEINYWDYLHGYIGVGIYALERYDCSEYLVKVLDKIIHKIENSVEWIDDNCCRWQSIIDYKNQLFGYNVCLSHGLAGLLRFLTLVYAKGIFKNRVYSLIEGCSNFLLSQRMDVFKNGSFFPTHSLDTNYGLRSRLGWCYGDLGIIISLYYVSDIVNNIGLKRNSLDMLHYIATNRRDLLKNDIADACFCHGTSGILQIFYRMWIITSDVKLKDAVDYWFNETLKMSRFEDGVLGYKTYYGIDKLYRNEYDLLNGLAGIGLVLLYYWGTKNPDWDKCFLLS